MDRSSPFTAWGWSLSSRSGLPAICRGSRAWEPVASWKSAYEQPQHDTYGHVVPRRRAPAFFDRRLLMDLGEADFMRLEGCRRMRLAPARPSGRGDLGVSHTASAFTPSSAVMCWEPPATGFRASRGIWGATSGPRSGNARAETIRERTFEAAWSPARAAFVESFGGRNLDASVLLMSEVGMIEATDPRFRSTVDAIERTLAHGAYVMRYEEPDDFGAPETAFNACAFWRIAALARMGRREEAREHFEALLARVIRSD